MGKEPLEIAISERRFRKARGGYGSIATLPPMDDPTQQRLFAQTPGNISPPEPGLYLGTSGWSYADWEGTVYPAGIPAGSRLAGHAKGYARVERAPRLSGGPRRSTVR